MNQSSGEQIEFGDLSLSEVMLTALDRATYQFPTPVQAGLIPHALEGEDVLGQAQTGTGKTASFAIPILERIKLDKKIQGTQALVLCPTRELAVQVTGEIQKLSFGRSINCVAIYGGKPVRGQAEKLKRGAPIVVGTPGRVLDLVGRGTLKLGDLHIVVLDEADRMLDIGFRPDIEKILRQCPRERQTLLLSATIAPPVERLARRYMKSARKLDFSPKDISVDSIEQYYFTVDTERKFDLLARLLKRENPQQGIVFCRTKRGTDRVYRRLKKMFQSVDCIHGDLDQRQRDRVMSTFRDGKTRILVATDVVGRGIDVTSISHIINYDIPQFCDDYIHRVGRAGRMGREGVAFTFVTPEQGIELTRIEVRINLELKRDEVSDFEATKSTKVEEDGTDESQKPSSTAPPLLGRGRGRRRHRKAL